MPPGLYQSAEEMEPSDLTAKDWSILTALHREGSLTTKLLLDEVDLSKTTFYYHLNPLTAAEFVEKIDHGFYRLGDEAPLDEIQSRAEGAQE